MGQVIFTESIEELVLATTTTVTLASSIVNIGGQQYQNDNTITLDMSTTGLNGLDVGSIAASSAYNIFAVYSSGELGLTASLSATPSGFTQYKQIGTAVTDSGTATLYEVSDSTKPLEAQTDNLGSKTASKDQADAPLISVPYTSIVGRAPIRDLSKIPSPKMGIERVYIKDLTQLENEVGPSGAIVRLTENDHLDRARFVGSWLTARTPTGEYIQTNDPDDFAEFTFYGTGFNILVAFHDGTARGWDVEIDGVAGSSIAITGSNVLSNRGVNSYMPTPIISGLSLGMHTVKITTPNGDTRHVQGFEIINESTTIDIPVNSAILAGEDRHLIPAGSSLGYGLQSDFDTASDTIGTKGGAVVVYSEKQADGSILVKQRFSAVDSTAQFITTSHDDSAVTHANEEVIKTLNWRQFGVGSGDDFADLDTVDDRAFALDDGTTTLVGDNVLTGSSDGLSMAMVNGNGYTITFVGTGLDIKRDTTADNVWYTIDVDGVNKMSSSVSNWKTVTKICSGLPYGTHIVKVTISATVSNVGGTDEFIIYGPKKPSLPEGAGKLGSYYLMADYSLAADGTNYMSAGSLWKNPTRETVFTGASWNLGVTPTFTSGFTLYKLSQTDGSYALTFFGTGCELTFASNTDGGIFQASIDGTDLSTGNFPSATFHQNGAHLDTATGKIDMYGAGLNDRKVAVSGLDNKVHTLKIEFTNTKNASSSGYYMYTNGVNVITPVHSYDASAELLHDRLIGSNSIKAETGLSDFHKEKQHFPQGVDLGSSKMKWQRKILQADIASSVPDISDLRFTNLTIGKTYRLSFSAQLYTGAGAGVQRAALIASHDGAALVRLRWRLDDSAAGVKLHNSDTSIVFTATATSVIFDTTISNGQVYGNGTTDETFATLEELPNHIETDEW